MAKTMLEKGYQHGQGLRNTMKGMVDVLRLYENKDKLGLGYKATPADRKRVVEEKKEKRLARLENREPVTRGIPICDIRQSFRSAGFMFDNQVVVIEEEYILASVHDAGILVYPCAPDTEINNWKIIEFPVILSSVSK
ncbi:G-patch domain [Sesbania bispinosa]|nr:G-patch domain [Sesbania bispinosa]